LLCDVDFLPTGNWKNTSNSRSFKTYHTLFNDERYGGNLKGTTPKYKQFIDNCFKILPRQALHAKTLGFVHPTTGEMMF
jgi:23S rRNA-/tRNA-specific pseudouridylate synthase